MANKFRSITLSLLFFIGIQTTSAQDTCFIVGTAKNYGDSIVIRWNAEDPISLYLLMKNNIVIEKKIGFENPYKKYKTITPKPINNWPINQYSNPHILKAASCIQNIQKAIENPSNNFMESIESEENLKFFHSILSLSADLSTEAAELSSLRWVDHQREKQTVIYKIYSEGKSAISDTVFVIIEPFLSKPEVSKMEIEIEESENNVKFKWHGEKTYSAYFVQKFNPISKTFENLNKAPIVIPVVENTTPTLYYTDSTKNYKKQLYRIIGMDLFSDIAVQSDEVYAMGKDKTPPPIISGLKVIERNNKLTLTWDKVQGEYGEKFISIGWKHDRHLLYEVLTEQALPFTQTQYEAPIVKKENDYYFLIQLFDTAGNSTRHEIFYQLNDVTAPEKPSGLKAIIDSLGVVTLKWNSNKELDLGGYLIYTSNDEKAEFSGLQNKPKKDTVFYDTLSLKMLNRNVYYKIVAVDDKMNRSINSDYVKVMRPDTLKPVSPSISDYTISDTAIAIKWILSSSFDVVKQTLIKQNISQNKTEALTISIKDTNYIDKNVKVGEDYRYYLIAEDENGNKSEKSNSIIGKIYAIKKPIAPQIFVVLYDSTKREIALKWEKPEKQLLHIVIYKGLKKDELSATPFKVNPAETSYSDTKIKLDSMYFYAIKFYYSDGTESMISQPLGVITN